MTNDKKKNPITNDMLIADVMLRITAIEKLLIEKGIFTIDELTATTEEIAKGVAKVVLEKAQASKTVDDLIAESKVKDKKDFNN